MRGLESSFVKKFFLFVGKLVAVIVGCGIYDVLRNRALNKDVLRRYFTGNGVLTWILSPFNTLLDIMTLPNVNKGVYKLEDFPADYQTEIQKLIEAAHKGNLVAQLEETAKTRERTMVFFKWYGANVENSIQIPAFHDEYKYVQTIGVSVFNKKQSTSRHFGPFRATLRMLYNINDMTDDSAYIEVGDVKSYWRTDKLFIFDDTLLHQSFNETDQVRYCLFVDILRPALSPAPLALIVHAIRFCLKSVNFVFYKNWDVVKS